MEELTNDHEIHPKKRGRPRKNFSCKNNDSNIKRIPVDIISQRELILHLPLISNKTQSVCSVAQTSCNETEKEDYDDNNDSESSRDLMSEISTRDKIIKKLKEDITNYKLMLKKQDFGITDIKSYPYNLKLIDNTTGKSIVATTTNLCCWWDTCQFKTMPCFIPERYDGETFYVIGCFCSVDCAAAYNVSLNDYKVPERHAMIIKFYSMVFKKNIEISLAHQREMLDKFGGTLTIENFRKKFETCTKEYKLLIPPCAPLVAHIEERIKDRTVSLKNTENIYSRNIYDSFGVSNASI